MTVACVWVRGHVAYTSVYVERLAAMVRQHLSRPHEIVCLTDHHPQKIPAGVRPIVVPSVVPLPGWWAKVRLFDPAIGLRGRVLYLDLDTLIVAPLAPIVEYPTPFALVPPGGHFLGIPPRLVVPRFNSSVMVWDAGSRRMARLWRDWDATVAGRLWGDQDWIGEQAPEAETMPAAWFPRVSEVKEGPGPDARVVLCKKPKNHIAARRLPWVARVWRAA